MAAMGRRSALPDAVSVYLSMRIKTTVISITNSLPVKTKNDLLVHFYIKEYTLKHFIFCYLLITQPLTAVNTRQVQICRRCDILLSISPLHSVSINNKRKHVNNMN